MTELPDILYNCWHTFYKGRSINLFASGHTKNHEIKKKETSQPWSMNVVKKTLTGGGGVLHQMFCRGVHAWWNGEPNESKVLEK